MEIERFGGVKKDINTWPSPSKSRTSIQHSQAPSYSKLQSIRRSDHSSHNSQYARIILPLRSKPHLLPRRTHPQFPLPLHRRTQTNRRRLCIKQSFSPTSFSLSPLPLPTPLTIPPSNHLFSPLVLNRPQSPLRHTLNLHEESRKRKQHHQSLLQ